MEVTKMNKIVTQCVAATLLLGVSAQIHAGTLSITNTFQSGTPASAAEVNQNFSDVKTTVDDNDSRISANAGGVLTNATAISNNNSAVTAIRQGLSVYDNGTRVGALVSASAIGSTPSFITLLSDTGYIESYTNSPGTSVSYTTVDCTGQAYYALYGIAYANGLVFKTSNTGVYAKSYIAPSATPTSLTMESYLANDSCSLQTSTADYVLVTPNDQGVTGIPNSYTGLLTIGN